MQAHRLLELSSAYWITDQKSTGVLLLWEIKILGRYLTLQQKSEQLQTNEKGVGNI